eukprot:10742347-Ditylum_brightwellii.AAC.1
MVTMVSTRNKKRLAEMPLNNFCLNNKQCSELKKLYSGGHGGYIHFNLKEDKWWSPNIEISDKNKDEAEKMKTP